MGDGEVLEWIGTSQLRPVNSSGHLQTSEPTNNQTNKKTRDSLGAPTHETVKTLLALLERHENIRR